MRSFKPVLHGIGDHCVLRSLHRLRACAPLRALPALAAFVTIAVASGIGAGSAVAGTMPMPTPGPSATPAVTGPCAEAGLASVAVRPGIGRAPATSGAVCVVAPGGVVLGVGYREQTTVGTGRQLLDVAPEPVALIGVAPRLELIIAPGLADSRRIGASGSGLPAISGQQDAGFGAQVLIGDRPVLQQALAVSATLPTGYPTGSAGFSSGFSSYTVSYAAAINVGGKFGVSTSQGIVVASGQTGANATRRYVAYQPTINFSYALATATTLLLEDQITAPSAPQGPTGNRSLIAVAQALSPNIIVDAEFELNLLPSPGFAQHALGAGVTVRL